MATEQAALPVNGNFVPGQQPSFDMGMQNNTSHSATNSMTGGMDYTAQQQQSANDLSKDEVGWYFVEQYYTTMSKSPEKLYVSLLLCWRTPSRILRSPSSSTTNVPNSSPARKPSDSTCVLVKR